MQSGARAAASTSLIFDKVEDPLIKHVCGVHPHITTGFLPIGCARSKIIAYDQLSCNMVRNMDYRSDAATGFVAMQQCWMMRW